MGYDSSNIISKKYRHTEIEDYLLQIGFKKIEKNFFYYFDYENYTSFSGIDLTIVEDKKFYSLHLHSFASASVGDLLKMNQTTKSLLRYFGGYFQSDLGRNRYFPIKYGFDVKGAECGCLLSYSNFKHNLLRVHLYLRSVNYKGPISKISGIPQMDSLNPEIVSNHLIVPFLVSIIEDYFKTCYSVLFKFSNIKIQEKILKNYKILPDDLIKISKKEISIIDVIIKKMSFQNIDSIIKYFNELNEKLRIDYFFHKPYRRKKMAHYLFLESLFNQRHDIIHRHIISIQYSTLKLKKDIKNIEFILNTVHKYIMSVYNWKNNPDINT